MTTGEFTGLGPSWALLLRELFELDDAGALSGIRAIVAERLQQVRQDSVKSTIPGLLAIMRLQDGGLRDSQVIIESAALLAAEIDRREIPGPGNGDDS